MERKELGKIENVRFGIGGYQDAQIGIYFTFSGKGWGVNSSECAWDKNIIKRSEYCKWTEGERSELYSEIVRFISDTLFDAKVDYIEKLKGIPVEVTFENNTIKSWRVLKEVL